MVCDPQGAFFCQFLYAIKVFIDLSKTVDIWRGESSFWSVLIGHSKGSVIYKVNLCIVNGI